MDNVRQIVYVFITLFAASSYTEKLSCQNGSTYMSCLPDGTGYAEYKCNRFTDTYTKQRLHICPKDNSACKCFTNINSNRTPQMCECVSAAKRPNFPSTGIIRWNGTYVLNEKYGQRMTYLPGKVIKDTNGRFLMKTTTVRDWSHGKLPVKIVEFEIVVPNIHTGSYIKYSGNTLSTKCRIETINKERELIAIWKDDPRKYYHLIKETSKTEHIVTHVWYQEVPHNGEEWKFTVDYDMKKRHAIPVAYDYKFSKAGLITKAVNLSYKYEAFRENSESFNLEDYCTNKSIEIIDTRNGHRET